MKKRVFVPKIKRKSIREQIEQYIEEDVYIAQAKRLTTRKKLLDRTYE